MHTFRTYLRACVAYVQKDTKIVLFTNITHVQKKDIFMRIFWEFIFALDWFYTELLISCAVVKVSLNVIGFLLQKAPKTLNDSLKAHFVRTDFDINWKLCFKGVGEGGINLDIDTVNIEVFKCFYLIYIYHTVLGQFMFVKRKVIQIPNF